MSREFLARTSPGIQTASLHSTLRARNHHLLPFDQMVATDAEDVYRSTNNSAHTNPADRICSRKLEYFTASLAARSFSAAANGISNR
jgi:hypothetical protein